MNDEIEFDADEESLRVELQEAGFQGAEITKAFDWLEGLARQQSEGGGHAPVNAASVRVYTELELDKLDTESRGFLLFLEQMGVLNLSTRELVIDRVMALEADEIDLEQLKWVILMVLFNQPGSEAAFAWMEDLVFDEAAGSLH
jgi:Smg protein